jgi:hypothetical protein
MTLPEGSLADEVRRATQIFAGANDMPFEFNLDGVS